MNIERIDLNLLVYLDVLLRERSGWEHDEEQALHGVSSRFAAIVAGSVFG